MSDRNFSQTSSLSRRSFLTGAAAAGAIATLGLAGCASQANSAETPTAATGTDGDAGAANEWVNTAPASIDKTIDTDVVIVGSGFSGSCCMMKAVENGLNVVVVDRNPMTGGATNYAVDTLFALGDAEHERFGQSFDPTEYVRAEMEHGQWRNDGARWWAMIDESPEYVEWLKGYGLEFVPMEMGGMQLPFFKLNPLMFSPGTGGGKIATDTLAAAAQEKGAQILLNTLATSLIQAEDGTVTGLYAESADEGNVQINAKAVVLATGGFGSAPDLWEKAGMNASEMEICGTETNTGDGWRLATAAGAMDGLGDACALAFNIVPAFPGRVWNDTFNGNFGWPLMAKRIEVNQDAVRFNNEDHTLLVDPLNHPLTIMNNQASFILFDDAMFAEQFATMPDAADALEAAVADGTDFYRCESAADAAEKFGLDAAALQATIDDYNAMCEAGADTRYAKTPMFLQKLETPFYMGKYKTGMSVAMGGVHTSSNMEVLTPELAAIPGLYCIGMDGCTLYKNFYTFGGGAMGHNCYSGRKAADVIAERLKA